MDNLKLQKKEEQKPVQQQPPIQTTIKPRKRPTVDFSGGNASLKVDFEL